MWNTCSDWSKLFGLMNVQLRALYLDQGLSYSEQTDARSFRGSTLVFFRRLLRAVDSKAAFVTIVGHELSHLDHGHQLVTVRRVRLAEQTFAAARPTTNPRQFLQNDMTLMLEFACPYRPEDEAKTDRDGVTWTYRLGYGPLQLTAPFRKRQKRNRNSKPVWNIFRTRPYDTERYRAVLSLYERLQRDMPNEKLYVGRSNLQRRITQAEHEFSE